MPNLELKSLRQALRRATLISADLAFAAVAFLAAFALRFDLHIPAAELRRFLDTLPYLLIARLVLFQRLGLFRGYWRHAGMRDLLHLSAAVTLSSLGFTALLAYLGRLEGFPVVVLVLDWLILMILAGGARFAARLLIEGPRGKSTHATRTLIIGAGVAGEQLLRQVLHDNRHLWKVVGLVDDDAVKHGRSLHGIPVLGGTNQLRRWVALQDAAQIVIAIRSLKTEQLRALIARCTECGVPFKILPPWQDLVDDTVQFRQVREVQIEDLLGREPVRLDLAALAPELAGKVVMVTGAGGSIGSELVRQIARFHPRRLLLLDRAESPLYFIQVEVSAAWPEIDVTPVLASVTNAGRLARVFETYRPELVFHAAAYKHVPMLEWNLLEGVWNNVVGTLRLAQSAARFGVKKFVLISTDKAVNPTSILGATKRIAEMIARYLPSLRSSATDFRVVRFGNVLGSDGSVVPLFKRQLATGGPITVTHPEVRRYFMTIPEAAQLVLEATALPEASGRIALLEMGEQVRILDLAEEMIRLSGMVPHQDVKIVFTGMRPGEKMEEELLAQGETAGPTAIDKIRVVTSNGHHASGVLARKLRQLIRVTASGDEAAVMRAIAALVPSYQPEVEALPRRNGHGRRLHVEPAQETLQLVPAAPVLLDGTHNGG